MKITRTSPVSGKTTSREIAITIQQLALWEEGGQPIQQVAPYLSVDDREFIMTGITPDEWDAVMGVPEDDDLEDLDDPAF